MTLRQPRKLNRLSKIKLLMVAVGAFASLLAPGLAPAQQVTPGDYAEMRWRSIGPYRSGNVYAVAGVPGDPTVYYIGLPEGGVWKTTDGGTVWKPVFDAEHVPSIGAVAVAPSNPTVVYVGTGDPSIWSFTPGRGVYKSTDAGETWRNMGLENTRYIDTMLVDSRDANIVLAGALGSREYGYAKPNTACGIFRSTDGGSTWKHVLYKDDYTGVIDLVADYQDPRVVYASFARSTFGLSEAERKHLHPLGALLYKSTDEGATWNPIDAKDLPSKAQGFYLAVASGTHGSRVYAEAQGAGRDAQGLFRSDDGGKTWSLGTRQIGSAGGHIYVDPQNRDIVYLMGTSMYRSIDGGHTFVSFKGSPGGDDNRDLWIDPHNPRRMLMGADQGPTITVDGGNSWTPWYNLANGQFYNIFTDSEFPYRVYGAQQDSGTAAVLSRSDYGEIRDNDWYPVGGFENGYIAVDPLNSRWIFTQGWYHVMRRYDRVTGQVAVLYSPNPQDHFGQAPPIVFSHQDLHVLYLGAQYVLQSTDGGRNWQRISPDLTALPQSAKPSSSPVPFFAPREPSIQTLEPSAISAGEIWVGTSNGLIHLTRDGGKTWSNVTPEGLPDHTAVNFIDASGHDSGTAYAAILSSSSDQPDLYRTTDYGKNWQKIVNGLPNNARSRVVREDPVNPDLLYAGTEMGVWVSFDRGDHWQSLQLNLPNTVVSDLVVHGNDLAISTYGRSLWILDDVTPLRQAAEAEASRSQAYLYQPEMTYRVRWDNDQDTPLPPEVPAGQNPPEGAILDYLLKSPVKGPVELSIYDPTGELVRQYSSRPLAPNDSMPNVPMYWFKSPVVLSASAGMHRIAWDLRYPTAPSLTYGYNGDLLAYTEYTLTWHAIQGETPRVQPVGPIVVPGVYRVQLNVDGQTFTRDLTIKNDPRISVSEADLEAQLQFERTMMAGMSTSYECFQQIHRLLSALAAKEASTKPAADQPSFLQAVETFKKKAAALESGTKGGFGAANRDLARHLEDMEFGDLRPTPSDLAAGQADCRDIDAALAAFAKLQSTDLRELNQALIQAHLDPLPTTDMLAAPACGIRAGSQH
ncbi:MAG: hypothetical protein WBE86_14950 [Candidatus Acidiferrales bacterium]